MSHAYAAGWHAGSQETGSRDTQDSCRRPRKGLEIVGIILGFIFVWPMALAYLVWKLMGYPVPAQWKTAIEKNLAFLGEGWSSGANGRRKTYSATGNFAFEDYRKRELERLEEERRRLDEEAHAFAEFVEELKRAKDREEFDAFMAKRRGAAA